MEEAATDDRHEVRQEVGWAWSRFRSALGPGRTLALVVLGTVGSLSVLLIGFAAVLIVQIAAADGDERIRGISLPSIDMPVLLGGVVVLSAVGVVSLLAAELVARAGANECASDLRSELLHADPHAHTSLVVQDVRTVANSGLVLSRLPGPMVVVIGCVLILLLLDTRLTLMLAPFALVLVLVGRRMRADAHAFSEVLESSRTRLTAIVRSGDIDDRNAELDNEASRGDAATFRLAGQSTRSQAAGLASVGIMVVVAVLGTDLGSGDASGADIARLIIYVIVARLLVRSLQQITASRAVVSRHLPSIRRCRSALVGGAEESG